MTDTITPTPNPAKNPLLAYRQTRLTAAYKMVQALCQPKGTPGSREWLMSMPAQPDRDPDLVIGAAISDAEKMLTEIAQLEMQNAALLTVCVEACNFIGELKSESVSDTAENLGVYMHLLGVLALCEPTPAAALPTAAADTQEENAP